MSELRLKGKLLSERYQVRGRISSGSYAEVFVARDLQTDGEEVVIKALNTQLQGTPEFEFEQTLIENFDQEATILESLSNPAIIALLGKGEAVDSVGVEFPFIALEYMQGGDLLRFTRTQPNYALSLGQMLNYFRQISNGLSHAHNRGIIHRDLKPNNFLLSADYQNVKIADFGVAKTSSDEDGEITRVGTGIYSAPEHSPTSATATFGKLTAAADIYSLAKSCYTLVCGRTPNEFAGKAITDLPPAIKTQSWSQQLLGVLQRATRTEASSRYGSVTEFWNDMANLATLDAEATKQFVKKRLTPEEKELVKKRAELAPLEAMLAQRKLDHVTLEVELREFEILYLQVVGVLYAKLDEINAQIAEAEAKNRPDDAGARERAAEARAQAKESAHSTESLRETSHQGKFNPPDSLKKLYRELARLIHPDLVLDEKEKARRHEFMAQANSANEDGNEELLTTMLSQWENSPDSVKGEGVGAELIRIIRRIAQAKEHLKSTEEEVAALEESDLYELRTRVDDVEFDGRDLLAEMAVQIKQQIEDAQRQFNDVLHMSAR
jgi:serine/threonine protein kinase